jgi:hypothetical protein
MKKIILNRLDEAILIVLYENHPLGLTPEEIEKAIDEKKLLDMTDKEFEEYKKNIILAKNN